VASRAARTQQLIHFGPECATPGRQCWPSRITRHPTGRFMRTLMSTRTCAAEACCSRPGATAKCLPHDALHQRAIDGPTRHALADRDAETRSVRDRVRPCGRTDSHSPARRNDVARPAASTAAKSRGRRSRRARLKGAARLDGNGITGFSMHDRRRAPSLQTPGACGPWRGAPRSPRGHPGLHTDEKAVRACTLDFGRLISAFGGHVVSYEAGASEIGRHAVVRAKFQAPHRLSDVRIGHGPAKQPDQAIAETAAANRGFFSAFFQRRRKARY